MAKKVYLESLGCPKNLVDSELALGALRRAGAEPVADETCADALIVNTCGFIDAAKEESIDAILRLARIKENRPGVKLAVMGCLSEKYRDELLREIPEIDEIFGTADLRPVVERIAPRPPADMPDPLSGPRELSTPSSYAYLKIAEGCSNSCSFCVIPSIRGPYWSRTPDELLAEAEDLARRGVRELILVAQDTTLYGADLRMKDGLAGLLGKLSGVEGIRWIRVLYMYPSLASGALLDVIAGEEKIVPYFDLPLQHVADNVLKRMSRPDTGASIRRLVERIREKAPGAAIRASFIVGFPGETGRDFAELLGFVEEARLDHAGCFIYSPEEGTPAAALSGAIGGKTAGERLDALMGAQRKISANILGEKVGRVEEVMVDGAREDGLLLTGRLETQAPEIDGHVILDSADAAPGDIIPVRITGAMDYDLIGSAASVEAGGKI
ncbi:MAG: 30S ribosomal protein S12 methylthiotransferase RimO [Candidatus Nitrospinota bacterium M3_3B_026]